MNVQSDQGQSVQSDQGTQTTEVETPKEKTEVTVNGKSYSSLEEMAKDYGSLHQEFHKRNRESAKKGHEEIGKATGAENVEAFLKAFQEAGFATKEDISALEQKRYRTALVENTPELAGKGELLATLQASHPEMAIEDVIEKYGLAKKDKLKAARLSTDVMGDPARRKPSSMEEDMNSVKSGKMSLTDFKKKHNIHAARGLKKSRKL